MKRLGILAVALACAHPQLPGPVVKPSTLVAQGNGGDLAIVQVREFPHSSTVSVMAWSQVETEYGLRAYLARDGALVRDHRLYVSIFYDGLKSMLAGSAPPRIFSPRFVETSGRAPRLLRSTGLSRDDYSCFYDFDNCTPPLTFGVRVPDELLRANADSLSIRVYGRGENPVVVTLGGDVIRPYLRAVDSVSAALRKPVKSADGRANASAYAATNYGLAVK